MSKANFTKFGFTKNVIFSLCELVIKSQLIYGVVNFDIFNIIQGLVFTTWFCLFSEIFKLWDYVKTGTFVDKEPIGINLYSNSTTYIGIQTGLFCYSLDLEMKWPFLIMNLVAYIFTCLILLYLPNGIRMTNMRRVNTTHTDTTREDTTREDTTREDTTREDTTRVNATQVETTRLEARQELDTLKQLISELKSARHELEKSKQEDAMHVDDPSQLI